jgi:hypothetical protein
LAVNNHFLKITTWKDIFRHSCPSIFLNSTNDTRFSIDKVSVGAYHRGKRPLPLIMGVTAGVIDLLFVGGVTMHSSIEAALLNNRISKIQKSISEINHKLHSLGVSVLTNTNTTAQLARSFSKPQGNMEMMQSNVETILRHVSRLDAFDEARTRCNLKTHVE